MNRSAGYFAVWSLGFIVLFALSLAAQPEGYVEVPQLRVSDFARGGCFLAESGVYDEEKLKTVLRDKDCVDAGKPLDVDFQKETLIGYRVGGDCHMSVSTKVFRSDTDKKYKAFVNNIYGGCRAVGGRRGWIVIDKVRPGYEVEIVAVRVDRINGPDLTNFAFPKPPSIRTRVPLETREVDLNGCLPTTGQSQWIIRNEEHLDKALDLTPLEKTRCREHLRSLNINFRTDTLVLYAFQSGHCARPPGLSFETIREFSSDASENRFRLMVRYDDPGENYCKVWTTYPLWVVVPKLPDGFGFEFAAERAGASIAANQKLELRPINLRGCIQTIFTKQFLIRNKEAYLKAVRSDASRKWCLEQVEQIDFDKYSLVGVELDTGYCRTPLGLEYQVTKDPSKKQYVMQIGWSKGAICRALSEYPLWVLVPRLPADYGLVFEARAK